LERDYTLHHLETDEDVAEHRESIKYGNLPDAIGELSMLLQMDPKNSDARFLRAVAYQKLEHYSKAIDDYNQILKYDPNHIKAHYNLAQAYRHINNQDGFISELSKVLGLAPQFIGARFQLALALAKKGECGKARELIASSPEKFPEFSQIADVQTYNGFKMRAIDGKE
jgi:tetratricopeptide (TPR) repeat protein